MQITLHPRSGLIIVMGTWHLFIVWLRGCRHITLFHFNYKTNAIRPYPIL